MDFGFTPEQQRFREEVSSYFKATVKPEWQDLDEDGEEYVAIGKAYDRELVKKGWWTLHWPKEYGGQGRDFIEQAILHEEEFYWEVPTAGGHARYLVGPALMQFGTEEQKRRFLPPISRAELYVCLGYTEPNAGSDLAAMETRAVLDGDEYVVNGHKQFITYGHYADYIFLAARTDPTVPKHKGITIFFVEMDRPGIRVSPLYCLNDHRINDVYLDDVRISQSAIVGEVNRGFYHMTTALNFERVAVHLHTTYTRILDDFVELCKATRRGGRPLSEDPFVRHRLADLTIDLEAWRVIYWRVVHLQNKGLVPSWEASMSQIFRKEINPKFSRTLWEIMDLYGLVVAGSPWAPMAGRLERLWRTGFNNHGQGGTLVTRNVIAYRGLNLPRQ